MCSQTKFSTNESLIQHLSSLHWKNVKRMERCGNCMISFCGSKNIKGMANRKSLPLPERISHLVNCYQKKENETKVDDFVKSSSKEKSSGLPSLDEFSKSSSKNGSSSWESVRGESRHSSRDNNGKNLDRRFTLKRNNEATNPLNVRKRKRDENGSQNKPVKSSKEMYDMLMKSTGKTRSPRKTY